MRILITGGAGFVGSNIARLFKRDQPDAEIVVVDNLIRRGSEINLEAFKKEGISFVYGDVRSRADLFSLKGNFDLFLEASAEPSVLAGLDGSPDYLLQTNLVGTLNCLEYARAHCDRMIFLSTSRVYSIRPLREIKTRDTATRFEIESAQNMPGITERGVAENFPTHLPRSLYGASKLASELVIQEYADTYKLKTLINRCGVIAGRGQFGKVDQGVFTLWVANHYFGLPLRYTGFGAQGHQVRDLLHPSDLYDLLKLQFAQLDKHSGEIFNVGGGRAISTSLAEFTAHCQKATGRSTSITANPETNPVDIPLYVTDAAKVSQAFGWKPKRDVAQIVQDIAGWIRDDESTLRKIFAS